MKINIQPIEKQKLDPNGELEVHSIFYTIQGEGPFTGRPAVFIRLAGCNLQCPGCDTEYTSVRRLMSVDSIIRQVMHVSSHAILPPIVVISGGEPFRQNIAKLVRTLVSDGKYKVQIETNGTLYLENMPWDSITVVCSPKTGKVNPRLFPHIDAFKYILHHESVHKRDGLPILALDHTAKPHLARPVLIQDGRFKNFPIYLQPMDCQDEITNRKNVEACIASCMRYGYILQLQTHKILGLE
jgi:7-carboxy-7-deazaguanine synthase